MLRTAVVPRAHPRGGLNPGARLSDLPLQQSAGPGAHSSARGRRTAAAVGQPVT